MIVVTGAAGFIGSNLLKTLYNEGYHALIGVDHFENPIKNKHLENIPLWEKVNRDEFLPWLKANEKEVEFIFHLGARTDTAEFDRDLMNKLNTQYTKDVWTACSKFQIPLVYASSAATYGMGEHGFSDDEDLIEELRPLNPYGDSKQELDVWALEQRQQPFFWAGLKFFNVYGPHEEHKGRMASVVYHAYHQIKKTGGMKLFRSHNPDFEDGKQLRDFISVEDICFICIFLMHHRKDSGIYNAGTGKARSFLDLTNAVFEALDQPSNISFIDTPLDIRDKYQYFTEAKMDKLRSIGYDKGFIGLEEGVRRYVQEHLLKE
ncbi:MAG TPA: ADP-glyceromanno-heptose 6-epimerase [Cytophagales bacterium]|nr:ADP-glyceromanno-heptose 6-epimerase [Cytophagales bacterium]HAA18781.1 ADP-glyceromanno-heptose 6-epimerase [Cytophagales bacterium]HAP64259.1 ADP-glyceromanno-heptose 6-epimerase [Cytophagales bacterium]